MNARIAQNGRTIIWSGADDEPASSTCGMAVVLARREMTPSEIDADEAFLARIAVAPVNPPVGLESYAEAHRARNAWIASLPRAAS
jgi:hypothetical protein